MNLSINMNEEGLLILLCLLGVGCVMVFFLKYNKYS
jgi:hypothetical protein